MNRFVVTIKKATFAGSLITSEGLQLPFCQVGVVGSFLCLQFVISIDFILIAINVLAL